MQTIFTKDAGNRINFTVKEDGALVDITGASAWVILESPSGTATAYAATVDAPNDFYYDIADADVEEAGVWKAQGKVTNSDGTFHSLEQRFRVRESLA